MEEDNDATVVFNQLRSHCKASYEAESNSEWSVSPLSKDVLVEA